MTLLFLTNSDSKFRKIEKLLEKEQKLLQSELEKVFALEDVLEPNKEDILSKMTKIMGLGWAVHKDVALLKRNHNSAIKMARMIYDEQDVKNELDSFLILKTSPHAEDRRRIQETTVSKFRFMFSHIESAEIAEQILTEEITSDNSYVEGGNLISQVENEEAYLEAMKERSWGFMDWVKVDQFSHTTAGFIDLWGLCSIALLDFDYSEVEVLFPHLPTFILY